MSRSQKGRGRPMARNKGKQGDAPRVTISDPEVTIEISAHEEKMPIEGNALNSGNELQDRQEEERIRKDLAAGNRWAWCTAYVRVTYRDEIHADAYAPCCSYQDEQEFREDPHCADMVRSCLLEINRRLAVLFAPPKGGR